MTSPLLQAEALRELVGAARHGAPPSSSIGEAVIVCCKSLIDVGEFALALGLVESAIEVTGSATEDWIIRAELVRCRAKYELGRFAESLTNVQQIRNARHIALERLPSESRELRIVEAANLWRLNQVDEAVAKLHLVRSELLSLPESPTLAWCAYHLSTAEYFGGHHKEAKFFALEALVSARRCGSRTIEAMALDNLNRVDRSRCRWASAEEYLLDALTIHDQLGIAKQSIIVRTNLGILARMRGALHRSLEYAESAERDASDGGYPVLARYASLLVGMIRMQQGRFAEAAQVFEAQVVDSGESSERASLLAEEFLGDVHLEQDSPALALTWFDRVWPQAIALVPKGDIVAELRRRRAECYYLLSRFDEAHTEAKAGLEHCRELGDRYEEAATYRVLALSAAAVGQVDEAKRWFDQGFAYYDDIETPYEWGKLWMAYGDWLRGTHAGSYADPQGAFEAYHAAREHFERMGAEAKLAEALARLTDLQSHEQGLSMPAEVAAATSPHTRELRKPPRRPRGSAELDRRSLWATETFGFLTRNKMLLDLLSDTAKLAAGRWPILILGESGTGKELVARGIHRLSGRAGQFMPVNCAALPREIIESELFGHVSGAFTGATRDKAGIFEVCDGGSVFLDEIAEMSLELQSRLLRFLESGEFRRVGATRNIGVDTRIVAATNRDRDSLEAGDGFRTDLYYRLAHAVVVLPPLRRRGEDIDVLVSHFLAEACEHAGKRVGLSDAARNRLLAYSWPGNVRQLRAYLHRIVILAPAGREIGPRAIELNDSGAANSLAEELEQAERRRIVEALDHASGSRTEAAKALGMSRTTMIGKMKRYGIR